VLVGAFAKFRKSTMFRNVCLSVHMEQLSSHWTNFNEVLYRSIFRKSVEKMKVLSKIGQ